MNARLAHDLKAEADRLERCAAGFRLAGAGILANSAATTAHLCRTTARVLEQFEDRVARGQEETN